MKTVASLAIILTIVLIPFGLFAQQQAPQSQAASGGTSAQQQTPQSQASAGQAKTQQQQTAAATSGGEQPGSAQENEEMAGSPMMQRCDSLMAQADEVMDRIDAMEKTLDKQVAAMNVATGQKKVDDMAAVINTMVTQRKKMRDMLTKLHHGMMFHLMAHRKMCRMHEMKGEGGMEGMKMGPMMKRMKRGMEVEAGNDMVVIIQK